MRIGTLTYHRADNYGAVLQAYSLREYLQEQGFEVENIDYWPRHHAEVYKLWCWDGRFFQRLGRKKKILYILKFPNLIYRNYCRKSRFNRFRSLHMNMASMQKHYDAVFYGSDTIWNKWSLNTLFSGFDSIYWGASIDANHKFSYAPSMGNVIDSSETKSQCLNYLSSFDRLSVRELHLRDKLVEWGFGQVEIVVDPTMLFPKQHWDAIAGKRIIKEDYILCYNLENSWIIEELAARARMEKKLRIVKLTALVSQESRKDVFDTAGPMEFLSLFKYASCVVTSSFHGVVFSIVFNKQFCFNSDVETERIVSLLQVCHLSDRFVEKVDLPILFKYIDYKKVNEELEKSVVLSRGYISECLKILQNNGTDLR